MLEFIIRRLMQAVLVLFVMTILVFFGVNVIGNPVYIFASSECTQACLNAIIADLGLDRRKSNILDTARVDTFSFDCATTENVVLQLDRPIPPGRP